MTNTLLRDLDHYIGGDLSASSGGDLATASGLNQSQQKVLRRLLTNPGDYILHPEYGAGLGRYIGQTMNIPEMQSLILGQMLLEDSVASSPKPVIRITPINKGGTGVFSIWIQYTYPPTGALATLSFTV
jgi:hypothetical protein